MHIDGYNDTVNVQIDGYTIHVWQEFCPVYFESLVQLMWGAPMHVTHGGLQYAAVRYFDADVQRPGLPPGVAALVDQISADRVSLSLVNTSDATRPVVIAGRLVPRASLRARDAGRRGRGGAGDGGGRFRMGRDQARSAGGRALTVRCCPFCQRSELRDPLVAPGGLASGDHRSDREVARGSVGELVTYSQPQLQCHSGICGQKRSPLAKQGEGAGGEA